MNIDTSETYRSYLRMWEATDPYGTDAEEEAGTQRRETLPEVALNALVGFIRRLSPRTHPLLRTAPLFS